MAKPTRQEKIRMNLRQNPQWVRQENARRRVQRARTQERIRGMNQRNREQTAAQNADITASPDYTSNENLQRKLADNQRRYQDTLTGLDDQERQTGVNYGMGAFGGSAATNPYSRAALLQRSYNQNQRASLNSMAGAGQLYSGATSNAFNTNQRNFLTSQDSLQKDFDARMARLRAARTQAGDTLADANEAANREAVNDASKLFPSTAENTPPLNKPKKITLPKFRPTTVFRPKNQNRGRR